MELKNQLCSYEQGKKLRELGIHNNSYFLLNAKGEALESWSVEGNEDDFISGFSSCELAAMIPGSYQTWRHPKTGAYHVGLHHDNIIDPYEIESNEAQARAAMLIYLIETGKVTAEECNQRLLAA